jgi:hypothetical protein
VLYSGYGFFAALLTPALLALDAFRFARLKQAHEALAAASALLIALASLVTFFVGYAFIPAAACYRFPLHPLYAYPWFAALLLANPFRLKGHGPLATTIGGLLLLVLICIAVRRFAELLRNKEGSPLARVIALLSGYTLLYIAAAAVGRLCFGLDYAQQSRYVVFMNLALFAFYLAALGLRNARTQRWAIALLFLGLLAGNFYPAHRDTAERDYFFETKTRWKQCYLRYEDITRCDREAGGVAHPNPAATHMKEKLDYLKAIA